MTSEDYNEIVHMLVNFADKIIIEDSELLGSGNTLLRLTELNRDSFYGQDTFITFLAVSTLTSLTRLMQLEQRQARITLEENFQVLEDVLSTMQAIRDDIANTLPAAQNLQYIQGADPAAGAEVLMTVPAGVRWSVYTFTAPLVASSTAGNRQAHLVVTNGANTIFTFPGMRDQKENQTRTYFTLAPGNDVDPTQPDVSKVYIPMPQLFLLPGYTLQTQTFNLKPTDNWGVPAIYVNVIPELA